MLEVVETVWVDGLRRIMAEGVDLMHIVVALGTMES